MSNFCHLEVVCIILKLFISSSYCQDRLIFLNEDEVSSSGNVVETSASIPEHLLIRMKDVYNVTDFLNRFVTGIGNHTLQNERMNITSRRGLSAVIASSVSHLAACKPEPQVVELEKPQDTATMLWPPCVRVARCGGCCYSKMLACLPVAISFFNVTVIEARLNIQAENFEIQGTQVISVEQHDRCICDCKERPEDCTPNLHEYYQSKCSCVCINQNQAANCTGPKKIWDKRECLCKCRRKQVCSTGYYFNKFRCRCEAMRISLDVASQVLPEHQ